MKTFDQFKSLPYELQSNIISEYNLPSSRRINKLTQIITKDAYIELCKKPISAAEVNQYVSDYKPDTIYFQYSHDDQDRIIPIGYEKFNMANSVKDKYFISYEFIEELDRGITYNVLTNKNFSIIDVEHPHPEPDLLTQYFIYKNRKCDIIKPNFSKQLILNKLNNIYHAFYQSDDLSLLHLYLYIRVNLQRFPVLLPANIYLDFAAVKMTDEALINSLYDVIDLLYEALKNQIHKLD